MDAKNIQIPTTIKDPATRRFIEELLKLIKELQDRVIVLEGNS